MTFSLALTDEQTAIQELVASLSTEMVDPAAREAERNHAVPASVVQTLHSTGLVAPVAAEYGGDGVPDALSRLLVTEGLAYGDPGISVSTLWSGSVAVIIGACGTDTQRAAHLPAFVANPHHRASLAVYEGYGRAPSEFATTITREAGSWRVRGRKLVVQMPSAGAPLLVVGRDPEERVLRAVALDPSAHTGEGLDLRPAGTHLGLDTVPTVSVDVDLLVAEDHLLGGADADHRVLEAQTSIFRICTAAAAIGAARRAVEYAAKYATERIAFGRPISSFQGVAFMVAEAHMRVEAASLQLRQTLELVGNGVSPRTERAVSQAVSYSTTIASEVTRDCVQVLGGHGFLTDHPVERWYRATAGLAAIDLDPTCLAFAPAL